MTRTKRGRKEESPFNFPLQIGDPKLREISKKVENFDDLGKIVEEMKSVARKYDALGLAAPQIGINQVNLSEELFKMLSHFEKKIMV